MEPFRLTAPRLHGATAALEVEQDPAGGFQGGRPGRGWRRHSRNRQGRKRRELLRGAKELHGADEKSGREIQRPEVRR